MCCEVIGSMYIMKQKQMQPKMFSGFAGDVNITSVPMLSPIYQSSPNKGATYPSGYTNMQIADKLCLSNGTVKNYISTIYEKLGTKERNSLIHPKYCKHLDIAPYLRISSILVNGSIHGWRKYIPV